MTLDDTRAAFARAAAAPRESPIGLPQSVYCNPELFALEVRMFRREWFCIGRVDQVAARGSYHSLDVFGEPILLTRDRHDAIHVFSRMCPHRGTELVSGCGVARLLVCPYHSWSFDLAGNLKGAPMMGDLPGFDPRHHGLRPIRFEIWEGFVFINLDGRAAPLAARLSRLDTDLADSHLADLVIVKTLDWGEIAVDWKVIAENSMECYHHLGTHARSLQGKFPAELSWTKPETGHYVVTYSEPRPSAAGVTRESEALMSAAPIVTIFPYTHFTARPEGGTYLQVLPLAAGRIHVRSHIMLPKTLATSPDVEQIVAAREARSRMITAEDFDICHRVQRTAGSRSAAVGRLSLLEEPLRQFYRFLAPRLGEMGDD